MKTKFLVIFFSVFIIGIASAQRTTVPEDLQITKVELGTDADSIGVLDSKKVMKYIPQTTLLDRAELQIQPKLDLKENLSNKAIDFSIINHTRYPSVQAVQTELGNYINNSQKAIPNGVATLDASGKLTSNQIPDIAITSVVASTETDLTSFVTNNTNYTYEQGDVIVIEDGLGNTTHYMYKGGVKTDVNEYSEINASQVSISQVNGLQTELDELNGSVIRKGSYDASVNNPNLSSPTDSSTRGHYYDVAVSGTQFGIDFKQGDMIISDGAIWRKANTSDDNVLSVFGRLGDITALESDYSTFFYTKTESDNRYANITGDIFTGTVIAPSFSGDGSNITNVNATQLNSQPSSYYDHRGNYLGFNDTDSGFADLFTGDLNAIDNANVIRAISGSSTNQPSGIGVPRSMISFGARNLDDLLGSDIIIGTDGMTHRYDKGTWRRLWDDSNLNPINKTESIGKTFATLPASPINGDIATITDASNVVSGGNAAGGGSETALVVYDGTNWVYSGGSGLPAGFYEEGTFTPVISGYTFTIDDAEYIRAGNSVTITFVLSNVNGSGIIDVTGMPFTTVGSDNYGGNIFSFINSNLTSSDITRLSIKSKSGTNGLLIKYIDSTVIPSTISLTNGVISCSITYKTNVYTP